MSPPRLSHPPRFKVGLPGKTEGVIFTPVPCEVVYSEPERIAISAMREACTAGKTMTDIVPDFMQINRYCRACTLGVDLVDGVFALSSTTMAPRPSVCYLLD